MEGTSGAVMGAVREVATSSARSKLGGLLLRPALRRFRDEIDPEAGGGAYLLGLRRLGVVCHGRFSRKGFTSAILLAEDRKSTRLNSSHANISYAVFCLKKKKNT